MRLTRLNFSLAHRRRRGAYYEMIKRAAVPFDNRCSSLACLLARIWGGFVVRFPPRALEWGFEKTLPEGTSEKVVKNTYNRCSMRFNGCAFHNFCVNTTQKQGIQQSSFHRFFLCLSCLHLFPQFLPHCSALSSHIRRFSIVS